MLSRPSLLDREQRNTLSFDEGTANEAPTLLDAITAQKMKFSVKDFFSKSKQIRSFLRIWSHLLKKSLIENFIFCAVDALIKWRSNNPYIFIEL